MRRRRQREREREREGEGGRVSLCLCLDSSTCVFEGACSFVRSLENLCVRVCVRVGVRAGVFFFIGGEREGLRECE